MPPMEEISLEPPTTLASSGESRYLTRLRVFGNGDPAVTDLELGADKIDPSQQKIQELELGADRVDSNNNPKTKINIAAALKHLTFREQHVLVQFWSPRVVAKHQLLTTIDQPFGLGVIDEKLLTYRRDSERNHFVVDKDHEDEDCSPAARVFRRGLPEWTPDITNYSPKDFSQQNCAIRCNLHGYLALPVFDSNTQLCVGVLELLMSSKYMSYAYEVQQLHNTLEATDLRTQQAFDYPILNVSQVFATVTDPKFSSTDVTTDVTVPNERRKKDFDKIYLILKTMCDIHSLPLAQTWSVSQHASFVSREKVIEKSCSSFDTRCVGKVCMTRAALPFHVQDLGTWPFLKACRERHLDRSCGFVGKALLSRGSCFCEDVTKLSEEEYPLVHNAHMNGLTSCFAIFLHSVAANDDYVLEFFLTPDIKDCGHIVNLVQTLKQNIEKASGFELGDSSRIQVVGPPIEVGKSLSIDPHTIQISSITTTYDNKFEMVRSDSESIMVNIANKAETSAILSNQWPSKQIHPDKFSDIITGTENLTGDVSNQWPSKQIYPDKFSDIITGTENLTGDDVTRNNINVVDARKNNKIISHPNVSMQKTSNNIIDAGEKTNRLKQGRKRKIDFLTMEAVEKHIGKPIHEAAKSLGVSRSTLKRFCRENEMPSWPLPKHSKKTVHDTKLKQSQKPWPKQNLQRPSNTLFGLSFAVLLMVRVKRWSCSIKSHGFSGKWWSCGRHGYLPSKSDFIYQAAHLIVQLRRWRYKNSKRNVLHNGDHPAVTENTAKPKYTINTINPYSRVAESSLVHASSKHAVANISDIKMVTVKATFKEDMIKFQFPTSSGLLELEQEVAQRIKLKSRRPRLKYRDEDSDLILLACDADLHHLLGFTANQSPIKLIIMDDD